MRNLERLVMIASLSCVNAHAASDAVQAKLGAEIRQVVQRHIEAGDTSGAIVLVARDGHIVYHGATGVADAATKRLLREDAVVQVGSMTKPIVATAVLMLKDEGKLKLDDPVSKYVPEFRAPAMVRVLKPGSPPLPPFTGGFPDPKAPRPQYDLVPANRPITLQDLLTHTSGLQTLGILNDAIPPLTEGATLANWVPKLAKVPLDFQPGTKWGFSNTVGFDVLAYIVEVVSGQPFDKFAAARIFQPLGMHDSGFRVRPELADRTMSLLPPMLEKAPCTAIETFVCGSGGLWMSAKDYWRFAQMLLDKGRTADGKQLLRPETVEAMAAGQIQLEAFYPGWSGTPGKGTGMGLSVLTVLDSTVAQFAVPNGSFGWEGISARRFWVIPATRTVLIMLLPLGKPEPVHRDIERVVAAWTE